MNDHTAAEWMQIIPVLSYTCSRLCGSCKRLWKDIADEKPDSMVHLVDVEKRMGFDCSIQKAPICADCVESFCKKYNITNQ